MSEWNVPVHNQQLSVDLFIRRSMSHFPHLNNTSLWGHSMSFFKTFSIHIYFYILQRFKPSRNACLEKSTCVVRKLERPFIRLSRLNQMNSRVMFRRWWGILWALYRSICCERINLQRKLHDKLKTCAVCYPFTTRDCSQFGTGERQSKGYFCHTCSRKCARPVDTYWLHKSKENPKNYFCNPDMWNCVSACEVCNFLAYEKSQCPKVTCLCSDL